MKFEVSNKHNPNVTDMWPISVSLFHAQKLPLNIINMYLEYLCLGQME